MPGIHIEIQGQSFDAVLPDARVTIGSAEDADLRIDAAGIALQQCTLEPLLNGLHKLKDANSGRPTKVNGVSIKQVSLKEGDVIEIGDARIVYRAAVGEPVRVKEAAPAQASAAPAMPAPAMPAPAMPAPGPAAPAEPKPASEAKAQSDRVEIALDTSGTKRERKKKSSVGFALALLVGVGVLVVIALAVGGGGEGAATATAKREYERGLRMYEAKDYEGARRVWKRLAEDQKGGETRRHAESGLQLIGDAEREMDARLERLWSERLDLTTAGLGAARASFLRAFGEMQAARFDAHRAKILAAQATWKTEQLAEAGKEVAGLIDGARFNLAREVWRKLGRGAPPAIDIRSELDDSLRAVDAAAEDRATEFIARAQRWIDEGLTHRARAFMIEFLPRFEGTSAYARMEKGLKDAQIAYDKPVEFGPTPEPGASTPKPELPKPPTTAEGLKALEDRARASLAKIEEQLESRRFAEAALALEADAATYPLGKVKARLGGHVLDLRLAETGLECVIKDINENPQHFLNVKFNNRLYVNLIDADRESLSAIVRGGRSKWRWERIPKSAFASLVRRLKGGKDDALASAALLHAVGLEKEADAALFAAGEKGVDTGALFPMLARWRGEDAPEGGYVVYEKRYVTPARRDHLVLEAKITDALKRLDDKDSEVRAKAYQELLAIGEPAAARYTKALKARRAFLIDNIAKSRSFTRYKAKLLGLLDERRKHALALIYDAKAYPYPNPGKKNQKEVEARVDKVREIWERPFDLVAQWDKKLGERLAFVTEVDEALADATSGYQPDLDVIKARINAAIDIPSAADASKREYSLKVLGFNETLDTTATEQEKDNTRVVNDYRMMMGLLAVKIEERILRAARGHSRHMAQNGYFAHNVPARFATPQNKSPGARARTQGFGGGVGENIARGPGTGRGAFMAWFGSSGHHRNMLGRGWLQMGCGRANGSWWTQLFAGGSKSLKHPDPYPAPGPAFAPDKETAGQPTPSGPFEVPEDEIPPGDGGLPGQGGAGDDPGGEDGGG